MDDASEKPRHSPWAWGALALVALAIAVVAVVFLARGGDSGEATASSGAAAGTATAPATGSADAEAALGQIRRQTAEPLLDAGKPAVFFMGAQWCPYCASERWALVEATSHFGKWEGLGELRSRPGQGNYPSLPTYDLAGATYTSDYISLRHKEVATVDGDPLQKLGGLETELVDDYDKAGSIPFLFASGPDGRYTVELAYSPALLEGQSFAALREGVAAGAATPAVDAIGGEADAITALLCRLDGGQPARVCGQAAIAGLGRGLE
jgi:thiol-disulfide isomerase/thioredoxin